MADPNIYPVRDRRHADLAFAATICLMILAWAVLYSWFSPVATILFFAGLLGYALMPAVDWLHEWNVPRWLGVLLVGLVGAGLIVLLAVLVAPAVADQVNALPEMVSETWVELQRLWERFRVNLPAAFVRWVDQTTASLEQRAGDFLPEASTVGSWATGAAARIGAFASGLIFVPIFVFLMLKGYHGFVDAARSLVPPRWRERFAERGEQADRALSGFVRGQLLVALVIGVLYATAFTIIGVPLGLVVGLIAGLGELVPYLRGPIALILASLLALAGGEPLDVLWVVAIFTAVQALEGGLISPWIMGRKAQLGPGIVIVSIVVGGELFGFVGLLAAVPFAALLKVAVLAAVDAYRASPFFQRRRPA